VTISILNFVVQNFRIPLLAQCIDNDLPISLQIAKISQLFLVLFISRYTKINKSLLDLLDDGIFPTLHVKSIPLYLSKILDQMFRILSTLSFIEHINGPIHERGTDYQQILFR
jgi:hypothetical protein